MLEKPINLLLFIFFNTLNTYLYLMKLLLGKYYDEEPLRYLFIGIILILMVLILGIISTF